ncbi:MAG: AtpZ/AtpI family protein [Chloroflexi bacterium]|nr:AtpZ/AtpI family protein [Chloroflexota bacterium]MCI0815674.1 AtpZ/AtpI family protein [Chloroflexota bacterium]
MNRRPWWVTAAQFTGIGWYLAAAIVLPTLGGVWLDDRAGTTPLFVLLGILLGVTLALYGTYRMVSSFLMGGRGADRGEGPRR